MKLDKNFFSENIKTLFYALIIAIVIRSLLIQPFYIPSSSMEPTLLVGDRLFVTKYSYGYSKHSFPFSPPILSERVMFNSPNRGDVVVFKTPADNRTDYIKRLIGLPGDKIQFIDSNLYLNNSEILKSKTLYGHEMLKRKVGVLFFNFDSIVVKFLGTEYFNKSSFSFFLRNRPDFVLTLDSMTYTQLVT